ncbi:uncharacterized protein LOC131245321 [Magnolia sinica]|uniref:uncharacterized protein LOC131245321 n=1 Tax=Magnolia sinica TaxID=86752 RepID=UPI00265AF3FA|nr:uncharacterized protein LOC131245321 [Magnolia sinica]
MGKKRGRKPRPVSQDADSQPENPSVMPEGEEESQSQDSAVLHENQQRVLQPQLEEGEEEEEDSAMADPPAHDSDPPSHDGDPPAHDGDPPSQQKQEEPQPVPASPPTVPAAHDGNSPSQQPEEEPQGMDTSPPPSPIAVPPAHDSESPSHNHEQKRQEDEVQAMSPSPPRNPPPIPAPTAHDRNPPSLPILTRKPSKRKKPIKHKQRLAMQKKLRLLRENLQPIPFTPNKTLDFSAHEPLFKTLGLWDFAHLEFDHPIRSDLLSHLIANYHSTSRCSFVKDFRIMVNRADLARALKLPVKKDKTALPDLLPSEQQGFSEESISIVGEFMSNYVLLHEDMWMMPDEILASERLLKEGQLQKIDWAGLIWFMVEKEISQALESGSCYYASHLQQLIKMQRPELFIEEEEGVEEVSVEEEDDAAAAVAMQELDLDNQRVELSLGHDRSEGERTGEDNVLDFQECKEEHGQWFLDGRSNGNEQSLRHCNLNDVRSSDFGRTSREDEEDGYGPSSRFSNLSRLASADLIQDMETTNASYGMHADLLDPSSGGLMRADMHKSTLPLNPGGLSMFGSGCKEESDDEDDVHHLSQDDHQRKMRNDGSWGHSLLNFRMCIGEVQSGMDKAAVMYEEKVQECSQARMNIQYLNSELEQRNSMICSMEKAVMEMQHKKEMEIYRLERELCVMTQLLHGYKMALKNTRSAFAEYRERCQVPDEPIYKDVVGTGGFVLSSVELEKQRLEKEEEERSLRLAMEEKVNGFEQDWLGKFDVHLRQVDLFNKKLLEAEEEIKLLKENHKTG